MIYARKTRRRLKTVMAAACAGCLAWCALGARSPEPRVLNAGQEAPAVAVEITFPSGEDRININTADMETLQKLDGIGPSLAEAIIRERDEHGFFHYP